MLSIKNPVQPGELINRILWVDNVLMIQVTAYHRERVNDWAVDVDGERRTVHRPYNKVYAVNAADHYKPATVHSDYTNAELGNILGKPSVNKHGSYHRERDRRSPTKCFLLSEDKLHRPITEQTKTSGKLFVPTHFHSRSRANDTLALTQEDSRYAGFLDLLPQRVSNEARETLDRYSFMIHNYQNRSTKFLKVPQPVTAVSVKDDETTVAVITRLNVFFFDLEIS